MANAILYVDSAATGTGTGATWANAFTTLAAAITASGTGGTDFYISSAHSESTAAALTLTFKGLPATPDRVFSCGKTNSPPTTGDLAAGAAINTTISNSIAVNGYPYIYGVSLISGSSTGSSSLSIMSSLSSDIELDNCKLVLGGSGGGSINFGFANNNSNRVTLNNTTVKFGKNTAGIQVRTFMRWRNTPNAIDAGGVIPTALFSTNVEQSVLICDGVDFSALGSNALNGALLGPGAWQFINCKMGVGMTVGTPIAPGGTQIDFINSDSTNTNYSHARYSYQGTLVESNSVYNNATDGTTPISWQVSASANANTQSPFECFDIIQWVPAGTYAASKIALTSTFAALTQNDVWVETEYLGSSSFPISSMVTTRTAALVPQGSTPAALTTVGATWATGGQGHNYTLAIPSFTTAMDGYVRFRVMVGNYSNFVSFVVYIDPDVAVA